MHGFKNMSDNRPAIWPVDFGLEHNVMDDPDTNVNPIIFVTAALGGRPIYAFVWAIWLFIAASVATGAQLLNRDLYSPRTVVAFTVGVIGTLNTGFRLVLFLRNPEQRRLLLSIDPRCAAQKVSGLSRVAVMAVPLLGLLAIAAAWYWR
jgi:hypothetical protein